MSTKKTPAPTGVRGSGPTLKHQIRKHPVKGSPDRQGYVSYYQGKGVKITAPTCRVAAGPEHPGKRGKIGGWSKASRRRMRMELLTSKGPPGAKDFGVTLTIPGPVVSNEQQKFIFECFCRELAKRKVCALWRVEIQERRALHWHLIAWSYSLLPMHARRKKDNYDVEFAAVIEKEWWSAVDRLGPVDTDKPWRLDPSDETEPWKLNGVTLSTRMMLIGAKEHAVHIKDGTDEKGAWLRYLQDHASKLKQDQIPENIGRHWGHINRSMIDTLFPNDSISMPERKYFKFLRAYQRLCTPSIPSPDSPFGRRLGYRPSRGTRGTSVWFSKVDTVRRLAEWAMSDSE